MKTKIGIIFLLIFMGIVKGYTQQKTISGVVLDISDEKPLPGTNIMIYGTKTGVATDISGRFTIVAGENDRLVVSFVGMKTKIISLKNKTFLTIKLERDPIHVSEALVVAYGTAAGQTYPGAAESIDRSSFGQRPITNILDALDGMLTGVQSISASGQPGSSPQFLIRGIGSINANATPLFIVDEVPYPGDITAINPDDIENITLLKDAAASALYGSRAANGVILITTRKGKKENTAFNVRIRQGITARDIPEYRRVNAYEYYPMMWEAYRNSMVYRKDKPLSIADASQIATFGNTKEKGIAGLLVNNPFNVPDDQIVGTDGSINPDATLLYADDLDWGKALTRLGYRAEYSVSAGGATERMDYYFSAGYTKENGYIIKSDFERAAIRANLSVHPVRWLTAGVNLAGTVSNSSLTSAENNSGYTNPFYFSRFIGPIYPIHKHDDSGELLLDNMGEVIYESDKRAEGAFSGRNIIQETELNNKSQKQNAANTRLFARLNIVKGLTFTANTAYDFSTRFTPEYENKAIGDAAGEGRAKRTEDRSDIMNNSQLLKYEGRFNAHSVEVLFGHESFSHTRRLLYGQRSNQFIEGNEELDNFTKIGALSSSVDKYKTEGYFTYVSYNYDQRYSLSASFRRDGTSRFHKDARWGNFGSVGAAWVISEENFMKQFSRTDLLKVRFSYGKTGNDNTTSWYPWKSSYVQSNNGTEAGFVQNTAAGNRLLKWESNNQLDLALEFGFFKRLRGTIEYFHRTTDDLLFNVPQPLSNGVLTQWQNTGSMYNEGFELSFRGEPIVRDNFRWAAQLNISHYRNEITSLPQEEIRAGYHKRMKGTSIYDFFLPHFAGVNPENGDALYYSESEDAGPGNTTNDINKATSVYCGTALPKAYGSLSNTLTYKGFSLTFLLSMSVGGKTYDETYSNLMHSGVYGKALHRDMLNRWQAPGDETDIPRLDNGSNENLSAVSDRWLTSASYLALRSAGISYNLPERIIRPLGMKGIKAYINGENLFLLTARRGMNPLNSFNGVSANTYTPARIFSLGIDFSF